MRKDFCRVIREQSVLRVHIFKVSGIYDYISQQIAVSFKQIAVRLVRTWSLP